MDDDDLFNLEDFENQKEEIKEEKKEVIEEEKKEE